MSFKEYIIIPVLLVGLALLFSSFYSCESGKTVLVVENCVDQNGTPLAKEVQVLIRNENQTWRQGQALEFIIAMEKEKEQVDIQVVEPNGYIYNSQEKLPVTKNKKNTYTLSFYLPYQIEITVKGPNEALLPGVEIWLDNKKVGETKADGIADIVIGPEFNLNKGKRIKFTLVKGEEKGETGSINILDAFIYRTEGRLNDPVLRSLLTFSTSPDSAAIELVNINDPSMKYTGVTPIKEWLPIGRYSWSLLKDGCEPISGELELTQENKIVEEAIKKCAPPPAALLNFSTGSHEVSITLKNEKDSSITFSDTTPLENEKFPLGRYSWELTKDGCNSLNGTIDLNVGINVVEEAWICTPPPPPIVILDPIVIPDPLPRQIVYTLTFDSAPSGAQLKVVNVNDPNISFLKTTPVELEVPAGNYNWTLSKIGHLPAFSLYPVDMTKGDVTVFEKLQLGPPDCNALDLGIAEEQNGNFAKALNHYQQIKRPNVDEDKECYIQAQHRAGMIYTTNDEMKDLSKALQSFQNCIFETEKYFGAYLNLGMAYLKVGEFEKARESLNQVLALEHKIPLPKDETILLVEYQFAQCSYLECIEEESPQIKCQLCVKAKPNLMDFIGKAEGFTNTPGNSQNFVTKINEVKEQMHQVESAINECGY